MGRRVDVRAGMFIEHHFIRRKPVARQGKSLPYLQRLVAWIYRQRWRERMRQVDDFAEPVWQTDGFLLRTHGHRCRHRARCHRSDEPAARHLLANAVDDERRAHGNPPEIQIWKSKTKIFSPCK